MEEYYRELGKYIHSFAICESKINQLIAFTNDTDDLAKGYKTVEKKINSLKGRITTLKHQVGQNKIIINKKTILSLLDKINIQKEFRNDIVHGIIGTDISTGELKILPLRDLDTGNPVKSTVISIEILRDRISIINECSLKLKIVINKFRLIRAGMNKVI